MGTGVRELRVSGITDHVYVTGGLQQSVKLNANGFFRALLRLPTSRCVDLLRIAAGIFTIDRIFKRERSELDDGMRRFDLTLEVRDLDFWRQEGIDALLEEILHFLTSDDWRVRFRSSTGDVGHQDFLELPRPFQPKSAVLFSGGLDSAAGLAGQALAELNDVLLVTVGHQSGMHGRTSRQLNALKRILVGRTAEEFRFLHSTLTTSLERGKARRTRLQEPTQRTRSFLFCSAGAVAAHAYGLNGVQVLENGVGSINLPLMSGMLGNSLATRGAHPTFLGLMSKLVGYVINDAFHFDLPFRRLTKGEMLERLGAVQSLSSWLQESRSCVHTSMRKVGKTHCGVCPACIERRQAFACAGISEQADIYQTDILVQEEEKRVHSDYLELYRLDAHKWTIGDESARDRMRAHLRLTDLPTDLDKEFCALQLRHSHEVLRTFGFRS